MRYDPEYISGGNFLLSSLLRVLLFSFNLIRTRNRVQLFRNRNEYERKCTSENRVRPSLCRAFLTKGNLTSSTGRRVDASSGTIGNKITTVLVRSRCKLIRGNMSCGLDRRCCLHNSRSRNVVFFGLHERFGDDGSSFFALLSISPKDGD